MAGNATECRTSVIVPARRAARTLGPCLEAVLRSGPPPSEVIVVEDGAEDDPDAAETAAICARTGARLVSHARRAGAAAARNAGAAEARGEILVFVDADVAPDSTAIGRLAGALDEDGGLAACFGSYDAAPSERNAASQYKNLLHHYVHQGGAEDAETFWTGLGAIRRSVFEAMGGFDPGLHAMEDIELGRRLRESGARIRIVKTAQGKHMKRWTAWSVFRTDLFDRALPWSELILRERFMQRDLNLTWRHRTGVLATGLALASLVAAPLEPRLLWITVACVLVAIASGGDFLAFLARERGTALAAAAIPLHLSYYAASGFGFALATLKHAFRRRSMRSGGTPPVSP